MASNRIYSDVRSAFDFIQHSATGSTRETFGVDYGNLCCAGWNGDVLWVLRDGVTSWDSHVLVTCRGAGRPTGRVF